MYYLKMFGLSLLLTLIVESTAAFCMKERGKRAALLVILVNVLTNPLAVLCCLLLGRAFPYTPRLLLQLPVEAAVFAAEAGIFIAFSVKKGDVIRHPVLLSAVCNLCSFGTGLLIRFILQEGSL